MSVQNASEEKIQCLLTHGTLVTCFVILGCELIEDFQKVIQGIGYTTKTFIAFPAMDLKALLVLSKEAKSL